MRVLLDESLPRQLAQEFPEHEVRTVAEQGWKGMKNGDLLRRAASEGFDLFLTADQNLQYQQNLAKLGIGVVVIAARTNRLVDLRPLVSEVTRVLPTVGKGEVLLVGR